MAWLLSIKTFTFPAMHIKYFLRNLMNPKDFIDLLLTKMNNYFSFLYFLSMLRYRMKHLA